MAWSTNVPLAILFTVLGSSTLVLSTALIAVPFRWEESGEKKYTRKFWLTIQTISVLMQFPLEWALSLVASFWGPTSIIVPVYETSYLLVNLVVFSWILKLEKSTKNTMIGTFLMVVSIAQLIFVGPIAVDEDPDGFLDKATKPGSLVLLGLLGLGSLLPLPYCILWKINHHSVWITERRSFIMLMLLEVCSDLLSTATGKMVILMKGRSVIVMTGITLFFSFTMIIGGLVSAAAITNQVIYIPINTSFGIIVNAVVGVVLWEDNIRNINAYICVFFVLLLSTFLMIDTDMLQRTNRHMLVKKLKTQKASRDLIGDMLCHEREVEGGKTAKNLASRIKSKMQGRQQPEDESDSLYVKEYKRKKREMLHNSNVYDIFPSQRTKRKMMAKKRKQQQASCDPIGDMVWYHERDIEGENTVENLASRIKNNREESEDESDLLYDRRTKRKMLAKKRKKQKTSRDLDMVHHEREVVGGETVEPLAIRIKNKMHGRQHSEGESDSLYVKGVKREKREMHHNSETADLSNNSEQTVDLSSNNSDLCVF